MLENRNSSNTLPFKISVLATLLCMLFGANAVAIKISLTGLGVFTNAAFRFGIAATLLLLWAFFTGRKLRVSKSQLCQLSIVAIVFFLQMTFFYNGQNRTSASHGVLITNLAPFVIMMFAHFLLPDEKIRPGRILGLLLGFSGVSLLLLESQASTVHHTLGGDLLVMIAVLFWGFNGVYVKKIIGGYNAFQITIYPMLIATPLHLLCAALTGEEMFRQCSPQIVLALLYQTLVTATFGFIIWNTLLARYGTGTLHSYVFIMPISGVFFGILLLGDPLTHSLIGAICLVTAGLVIINRQSRRSETPVQ